MSSGKTPARGGACRRRCLLITLALLLGSACAPRKIHRAPDWTPVEPIAQEETGELLQELRLGPDVCLRGRIKARLEGRRLSRLHGVFRIAGESFRIDLFDPLGQAMFVLQGDARSAELLDVPQSLWRRVALRPQGAPGTAPLPTAALLLGKLETALPVEQAAGFRSRSGIVIQQPAATSAPSDGIIGLELLLDPGGQLLARRWIGQEGPLVQVMYEREEQSDVLLRARIRARGWTLSLTLLDIQAGECPETTFLLPVQGRVVSLSWQGFWAQLFPHRPR
jgi:hypothetical protein